MRSYHEWLAACLFMRDEHDEDTLLSLLGSTIFAVLSNDPDIELSSVFFLLQFPRALLSGEGSFKQKLLDHFLRFVQGSEATPCPCHTSEIINYSEKNNN